MSDFIQELVFEKTFESGKLVRTATVVLVTTCVLFVVGAFNSLQSSFINSRLLIHESMIRNLPYLCLDSIRLNISPCFRTEEDRYRFEKAKELYLEMGYTKEILFEKHKLLEESNLRNRQLFSLPIVGSTIDINDLSIAAGTTTLILLVILFYLLKNRLNLLNVVREYFKEFEALGTNNTDPEKKQKIQFNLKLAKLLFNTSHIMNPIKDKLMFSIPGMAIRGVAFAPAFVCFFIVCIDLSTMKYANFYSKGDYGLWGVIIGLLAGFLNLFMGFKCNSLHNQLESFWNNNN